LNSKNTRAAILAALAGLGLVTAAQAEPGRQPPTYFQAGIGGGMTETNTHGSNQGSAEAMLGFRFNQYVAVQAIAFQINDVAHSLPLVPGPPLYDFERFYGGQVVGFIPATPYWDIFGEVGAGQSRLTSGTAGAAPEDKGDWLLGGGLRWQITDHFAASLNVTRLWEARATNGTLRAEVNF
jgi:hypothetical protein